MRLDDIEDPRIHTAPTAQYYRKEFLILYELGIVKFSINGKENDQTRTLLQCSTISNGCLRWMSGTEETFEICHNSISSYANAKKHTIVILGRPIFSGKMDIPMYMKVSVAVEVTAGHIQPRNDSSEGISIAVTSVFQWVCGSMESKD